MTLPTGLQTAVLLAVAFSLFGGGNWHHSDLTAQQDVSGVTIAMAPSGAKQEPAKKIYADSSKVYLEVIARNETDQRVRILVVDVYYQNRPRLLKDGKLVSYRQEAEKLVHEKDTDPEFVRPGYIVFLEPYSTKSLGELKLSDWYPPLKPGVYRLTNRHRFDMDGPWSRYSTEFVFEVKPE